jgi:hypothetical protein
LLSLLNFILQDIKQEFYRFVSFQQLFFALLSR